ncbi:MAG TPA: VOC family protein [Gammaproteobacteria bacterium]|nr:VOC family protein [Gammaproteobacteria bacterium]
MSAPEVAYVAVAVSDVAAASQVFSEAFGLGHRVGSLSDGTGVPIFTVGRTAIAVFEAGHPFIGSDSKPGVHHVAIAAPDPSAYAKVVDVPAVDGTLSDGIDGVPQIELEADATCGVRLRVCRPLSLAAGDGRHVERIDHLGVAASDNARAAAVFSAKLGCPVESTQTDMEVQMAVESFTSDKYGVVYHNRPPQPVGGLRVSFLTAGDFELEFLQPFDPVPEKADPSGPAPNQPGNTRGDRGAIGRFIHRRGPGLHHIALKTPHIDRLLPELAQKGLRMIDLKGRPGSRRALIGFVHPASLGGLLLHFVERDEL